MVSAYSKSSALVALHRGMARVLCTEHYCDSIPVSRRHDSEHSLSRVRVDAAFLHFIWHRTQFASFISHVSHDCEISYSEVLRCSDKTPNQSLQLTAGRRD